MSGRPANAGLLRRVRTASVLVGGSLLLYAMVFAPDRPMPRDLAWSLGVAALVLSLVANWLLRKQPPDA